MGFNEALSVLRGVIKKYSEIHSEAVKEVKVSRVAAFNIVGEFLSRAERILMYLVELERIGGEGRVTRICGNWVLVKGEDMLALSRVKPALAVTYASKERRIMFKDPMTSVSVDPGAIKIRFRGVEKEIKLTRDEIERNADLLKSLGSKILFVIDAILARIEACGRSHGIRL